VTDTAKSVTLDREVGDKSSVSLVRTLVSSLGLISGINSTPFLVGACFRQGIQGDVWN
jgi:hypothetical protein